MKIIKILAVCLLIVFLFPTDLFSDLYIGLYKIAIKQGWNLVSLPMQTLQTGEGQITGISGNQITDNTKAWTADEFKNAIVLISSGSAEGYFYKISGNTADTLTLASTPYSSITTGNNFCIYKAFTLTELFGDSTGPLYAAANKNDADEIYLWNTTTRSFSESIWLCNTPGSEGWWQGASKITDNSITVNPNAACFVVHKQPAQATVNYRGIVPRTKQTISINIGSNISGNSFPTAVTLASSGLQAVLHNGMSSYTADNIYVWDYNSQSFGLPIWYSDYPGYSHWYRGATIVDDMNLSVATGFMANNKITDVNWQRSKPYTNP